MSTPIRKVRLINKITEPIHLKAHKVNLLKSNNTYKNLINVSNDENILVAVYRNQKHDKFSYSVDPISLLKLKTICIGKKPYSLEYKGKQLYCELKKGDMVLFFEEHPDEINYDDFNELNNRLYKVIEIHSGGRIKFKLHSDARNDEKLKEYYKDTLGDNYDKTLVSGKSKFVLKQGYPKLNISPVNLNIVPLNKKGFDLKFSSSGKLIGI